jgi:hypothetical protein
MDSPHLKDVRRPLLPCRNLAVGEEAAGQTGGQPTLTQPVHGVMLSVAFGLEKVFEEADDFSIDF